MKTFNLKLEIINDFVFKSTKMTVEYRESTLDKVD